MGDVFGGIQKLGFEYMQNKQQGAIDAATKRDLDKIAKDEQDLINKQQRELETEQKQPQMIDKRQAQEMGLQMLGNKTDPWVNPLKISTQGGLK